MEPGIIYEDKNFVAVNKPAGLLVHQVRINGREQRTKDKTLVDWLLKKYPEIKEVGDEPKLRPGIVHRLDKATSGVMLVAKNQRYFDYLKNLFQRHEIKKRYLASVYGEVKPKNGVISKPIGIRSGSLKRSVYAKKKLQEAITEYRVKKVFHKNTEQYSLLEITPKTGRTHQIRIHLAAIGHPIVGDPIYASRFKFHVSRMMLHAESVEFNPEPGRRIKLSADIPKYFAGFIHR